MAAAADDESSGSSTELDEEEDRESFDDKMKRLTKLGREGKINDLVKEASLADCSPEMIAFAAQKSKELGNAAFQKREYAEALDHYAGALMGEAPEKYKIFSNRSACLFALGRYAEALVEATKSIRDNKAWSKGYYRAGRAAMELEYYQEAYEMFQKGLEKEPGNKDIATWAGKAKDMRNQLHQSKLMKKHTTDYSKFDEVTKQQKEEEDEEERANDPNAVVFGEKYYSSSKMEQRQLKAMLGYKEDPPPPFEPTFDPDLIYRHDARGAKTQHPIWDPSRREWRMDAKPAPSRMDYSDSEQTQAIALYLERQSDVSYSEDLLHMLDEKASPLEAYVNAVREIITQLVGDKSSRAGSFTDDVRWLFLGIGTAMPVMTAARFLPTAELIAVTGHRPRHIADLSMAILAGNKFRKEQVRLIHRPSHELNIVDPEGEDINNLTGKVDIATIDYENFDAGLIGKGVLPRINHLKKKILTASHMIIPSGAMVSCSPCEIVCPKGDGPDELDWRAVDKCRWGAFYESANMDNKELAEPWRALGPVLEAFEFDFTDTEVKLVGQTDLKFVAAEDGILNCVMFWYRLSLTENVLLDHTPQAFRGSDVAPISGDYPRHALQWLASPVPVCKGDEVHIRATYSRARIRFEVLIPEMPKVERSVSIPRWMYLRFWDEQRTDAWRKAIGKALDKVMAAREEIPESDRRPLRIVHLGAGLGQVSMVAARCLRDVGWTEEDVETHGYSVIGIEQMPKVAKLVKSVLKDNSLDQDVFFCSEDVRKLPSQPQRAQVILAELVDPGLLGEGILPLLAAGRIKTCDAFNTQVVPSRGTIWAAAFEIGEHLADVNGFDMSMFNHYRGGHMIDISLLMQDGCARQMSTVFKVFTFDFVNNVMPARHTVTITPLEDGKISAIVFWYEVAMDTEGDILLTNWPESLPPADFSMSEKDLHYPAPNRQAVQYFEGHYIQEVKKGETVELDCGYTQSWPQFVWPGTEMVQKESGDFIPKPPKMPMHRLFFEKFRTDTQELEKKLQGGLMFDEDMLGDGFAAAERVALEPNGNPNYLIDPNQANFFHMMFFL